MRFKLALRLLPRLIGESGYLRNRGYVFLISHMRSYSSLLSHLVGSHPLVAGYAEAHQKYRNVLDLVELSAKVENASDRSPAGRYVFDKILHGSEIDGRILSRKDLYIILSMRRPEPAIASILKLKAGGIEAVGSAVDYYLDRVASMKRILRCRKGRVMYMDAEAILDKTDATLARLSAYIGLTPGLDGQYSTFRHTGVAKYGDPSTSIRSGRIIRERNAYEPPALTFDQRQRLDAAYQSLRESAGRIAEVPLFSSPVHAPHQDRSRPGIIQPTMLGA